MLIFYSQVKNPDSQTKVRFDKIKKRIGVVANKIRKDSQDKIIVKSGENWLAIFQFANS